MNSRTAKILSALNNNFYRSQFASFAATRQLPWPGWERCLALLQNNVSPKLSIFDLACGNLRFESYLASALPQAALTFHAVDNCDSIVPTTPPVSYQSLDILGLLLNGAHINNHLLAPLCDLSVSFGFMHHVPIQEHREAILQSLVQQTLPGGYVIASLWQFLKNKALRDKAHVVHRQAIRELNLAALNPGERELEALNLAELDPAVLDPADLDENDFLLGWKDIPGAYRYCHSFSDAEIDRLVESLASTATVISRFTSDGRTNNLNTYLILRVC